MSASPRLSRARLARAWLAGAWRAAYDTGQLRHWGGFLAAGLSALATDASILVLLTRAGMSPFLARPVGIACAMVVSWWINRTVTFATSAPPTVAEFLRFAGVSITSQTVNYCVFAAILLAMPGTEPLVALVMACLVSMLVSYTGFRFGVFGPPRAGSRKVDR